MKHKKYKKYKNDPQIIMIDNREVKFDSKKELNRYFILKTMEDANLISELELQPKFLLTETIRHNDKTYSKSHYIADFRYKKDGVVIVEDVKSPITSRDPTYRVKIKFFLHLYGSSLTFLEV